MRTQTMANNAKKSGSPVEKFALFIEGDDFDETTASTAAMAEEVRRMGIDPAGLTSDIRQMVSRALANADVNDTRELAAETHGREFWRKRAAGKSTAAKKTFDHHRIEEVDYIPLAAKTTSESLREVAEPVNGLSFVASASVDEVYFEILRDAEAYVYLMGPVPET